MTVAIEMPAPAPRAAAACPALNFSTAWYIAAKGSIGGLTGTSRNASYLNSMTITIPPLPAPPDWAVVAGSTAPPPPPPLPSAGCPPPDVLSRRQPPAPNSDEPPPTPGPVAEAGALTGSMRMPPEPVGVLPLLPSVAPVEPPPPVPPLQVM